METETSSTPVDGLLIRTINAWLPTSDVRAREMILEYLQCVGATGVDPLLALQRSIQLWFGAKANAVLPTAWQKEIPPSLELIPIQPLESLRKPTMWPQRPKRISDELFSSWLYRSAVAAAVPPLDFAKQMLGNLHDVDRDVAPATVGRLAELSGQSYQHLAAGTVSKIEGSAMTKIGNGSGDVLLSDERFLLVCGGRGRTGGRHLALQYCPRCLKTDEQPYFRRAWRFSFIAVCLEHGCSLHDRCWHCQEPVDPLKQRIVQSEPHCAICGVRLSDAKEIGAYEARSRQFALMDLLSYIESHLDVDERGVHLDALLSHFNGIPDGLVETRMKSLNNLRASRVGLWFGIPYFSNHAARLQRLAEGVTDNRVAAVLALRKQQARSQAILRDKKSK
jgi:hypothetical protein